MFRPLQVAASLLLLAAAVAESQPVGKRVAVNVIQM